MNSKTVVWLWRPTPSFPLAKLGFFQCLKADAEALVAGAFAQWPKIGAYRFNFMDKMATTIALGIGVGPAAINEGESAVFTITLAEGISAPVKINLARDASSTAVAGVDYVDFPAQITLTPDSTEYELTVTTIDTAAAAGKTLAIRASAVSPNITGTPVATLTINDVP